MANFNHPLVYSTDGGRIEQKSSPKIVEGDGIARIRRETKGRKGKGVITITGIRETDPKLKELCKQLKKLCGCGGSVKDGVIEIQGDKRDVIQQFLQGKGYQTKMAGG